MGSRRFINIRAQAAILHTDYTRLDSVKEDLDLAHEHGGCAWVMHVRVRYNLIRLSIFRACKATSVTNTTTLRWVLEKRRASDWDPQSSCALTRKGLDATIKRLGVLHSINTTIFTTAEHHIVAKWQA